MIYTKDDCTLSEIYPEVRLTPTITLWTAKSRTVRLSDKCGGEYYIGQIEFVTAEEAIDKLLRIANYDFSDLLPMPYSPENSLCPTQSEYDIDNANRCIDDLPF